ncbi:hypothetical protein B0T11DRAFT_355376 [Plectosphaerella cucumerina]|uniref:SWIM-type domain-containing protein n=1 Tax=Plectosphaerella cucumerina TaxID=40658 RepID=A0A8K0X1L4_9PEZI|nr:hypothetical protein B0T11DRAFT_355376 [Plectosphaerella cucumerina]
MSAPTSKFGKLSLGGMTPTTRSRAQAQAQSHAEDDDKSSTDIDSESDSSLDDEAPSVIRSPSRLSYRVDNLPPDAQSRVREAFKDPPRLTLQYCRLRDGVYAFQMSELVPRSIRIGGPGSPFPSPRCSCAAASNPCKHILWLLDQLARQTLYGHDPGAPLTMKPEGYAEEVGDPYGSIASFHLDVAAEGLHCEVVREASDSEDEDSQDDQEPTRAREARELLAAVADQDPESYRPDIFASPLLGKNIIKRHDLERTVARMLLDNADFYHYFLSLSRPSSPARDPFRRLEQRVTLVLRELDASSSPSSPEGPRNVAWAATHITGVAGLIRSTVFRRDRPAAAWERISACRALVRILAAVASRNTDAHPGPTRADRNLYARLIGDDAGGDFIIGTLLLLPDAAAQFLQDLEVISDIVGVNGAPGPYVEKLARLLSALKKPAGGGEGVTRSSSKRQGRQTSGDRWSKRMK